MNEPFPLAAMFRQHLRAGERERDVDPAALEPALRALLDAARAAWPGLELEPSRFLAFLARRCPADASLLESLASLRTVELYLVCAALEGDPAAIETLQTRYFPGIDAALGRMGAAPDTIREIRQHLAGRLLVDDGPHGPRLARYGGRGDLQGWLCITAVREARKWMVRERRVGGAGEDALLEVASPNDDPEIRYLKQHYGQSFKVAFQEAVASLSSRERNVLRYHLVEGLNIERIGALYQVHRATVARWIAAAREQILAETRERLLERLQVDRAVFESIVRLIQSQLDVSACRVLREEG